jgi:tetratricopeptide (TPR) repeat protein
LQAKARADLLEGNTVPAIASLELALSERPADLSLKTDLASAYFENGEGDRALSLLDEVVGSDPVNTVALFNRALLLSTMGRYVDAASAWMRYLEIDPAGEWSSEARAELTKARTLGGMQ